MAKRRLKKQKNDSGLTRHYKAPRSMTVAEKAEFEKKGHLNDLYNHKKKD